MKTIKILFAIAALMMSMQGFAQDKKAPGKKQMNPQQLVQMRCNRIASELALDDATTAKFTDVYSKYAEELKSIKKDSPKKREKMDTAKVKKLPTDAEVEAKIKARFAQKKKMLELQEKYYAQYRKFLSPKQIEKMYQLEKKDGGRKKFGKRDGNRRAFGKGMGMNPDNKNGNGKQMPKFRGHGPQKKNAAQKDNASEQND